MASDLEQTGGGGRDDEEACGHVDDDGHGAQGGVLGGRELEVGQDLAGCGEVRGQGGGEEGGGVGACAEDGKGGEERSAARGEVDACYGGRSGCGGEEEGGDGVMDEGKGAAAGGKAIGTEGGDTSSDVVDGRFCVGPAAGPVYIAACVGGWVWVWGGELADAEDALDLGGVVELLDSGLGGIERG